MRTTWESDIVSNDKKFDAISTDREMLTVAANMNNRIRVVDGLGNECVPSPALADEIENTCSGAKDDMGYDIMLPKTEAIGETVLLEFPEARRARAQMRLFHTLTMITGGYTEKGDNNIGPLVQQMMQHLSEVKAFPGFTVDHIIFAIAVGNVSTHPLGGVLLNGMLPFSFEVLQAYVQVLGEHDGAVIIRTLFKILTESYTSAKEVMCTRLIEGYEELPRIVSGFVKVFPNDQDLKTLFAVSDKTGELLAQYAFHALNDSRTVTPTDLTSRKRKLDEVSRMSAAVTAFASAEEKDLEYLEQQKKAEEKEVEVDRGTMRNLRSRRV
jgi:hypothetical protein